MLVWVTWYFKTQSCSLVASDSLFSCPSCPNLMLRLQILFCFVAFEVASGDPTSKVQDIVKRPSFEVMTFLVSAF